MDETETTGTSSNARVFVGGFMFRPPLAGPTHLLNLLELVAVKQGTLNYLFLGNQTIQIYGKFEGFTL